MTPVVLKVLFLTRKWPPAIGGMETYCRELASALEARTSLTVVRLPGRSDGGPPRSWQLAGFLVRSAAYLIRYGRQFDVVHFSDLVLFPLILLHRLLAPDKSRIVTVYGLDMVYGQRRGWVPRIYRACLRFVASRRAAIDAYVAISENTKRIACGLGLEPVVTIPLGVRLDDSRFAREKELSLPDRYLFFFGRIVPRKGLAWFAEQVLPRLPQHLRFCIAGPVWDEAELRKAMASPRCIYLGRLSEDELNYCCRRARAVVMPNIDSEAQADVEGFGLAALEAVARGGILLASDLEGLRDAVRNRETGFLVRPGAAVAWSEAIARIDSWDSERRAVFVGEAQSIIASRYSWMRVADATLQCYEASGRSPSARS